MAIKELKTKKLTWINIDAVDQEALTYLKTNYQFHELDFEDIQSESQTPKIDSYKNYLFVVLQFPQWSTSTMKVTSQEVDIFLGDGYLITIQHTKSKDLKNFFYRCMKNTNIKKEWMATTSGNLLYHLLEALFKNTQPVLDKMGRQLSAIEQDIYEGDQDPEVVKKLALHRRNVLQFRRILDPQRYLVSTLSHTRRNFLDQSLSIYFDDVTDYLNKLWAIVDSYKDTVEGLHVTVESLITHRTNKVISALTLVSVALLPLTLFAGLYGMNIALPYAHSPAMVWGLFCGLTVIIVVFLAVLKRNKWL